MSRPRRSRQIRSPRARAFKRTLARVNNGALEDKPEELATEQARLRAEGDATGARAEVKRVYGKSG